MTQPRATRRRILAFALGLPGAYLDHPWGEDVAKVGNNKVFVFLGLDDDPSNIGMTVKLDDSQEQALAVPGAAPTGYGLGALRLGHHPVQRHDPSARCPKGLGRGELPADRPETARCGARRARASLVIQHQGLGPA